VLMTTRGSRQTYVSFNTVIVVVAQVRFVTQFTDATSTYAPDVTSRMDF
jgi:hypothetical protein